jgi:hypothetical protein
MTGFSNFTGLSGNIGLWNGNSGLWGGATGLIEGGGASLYLNFLAGAPLDSRVTFTRGSNATLVDSTGKITYAPANLLLQSQTFDTASWSKVRTTITANSTVAPDGTSTADKLVEDTTASSTHFTSQSANYTAGTTYTLSVSVKAAERSWFDIQLPAALMGTIRNAFFDVSNGTVGTVTSGVTAAIVSTGNGWYRCSVTFTPTASVGTGSAFLLANADNSISYTGNGTSGIFIWGAQLEPVTYQTTPSTYVATTTAAYYGPRFDYDPVTLAPKGLLIEEQRTNLVTYSEQFDNGIWQVLSGATKTANTTVSPDGTTNADTITATSNSSGVYQTQTASNSTVYTTAAYFKAGTGSEVRFGLTNQNESANAYYAFTLAGAGSFVSFSITGFTATSASITSAGNGWYRCVVTGTSPASGTTAVGPMIRLSAAGTAFAWGAQLEAGAFATSYIPTVASQVTRSADVASMTGTNFSSWYNQTEGTFVGEAVTIKPTSVVATAAVLGVSDGTGNNRIMVRYLTANADTISITGGATEVTISQAYTANSADKLSVAYATNNYAFAKNGSLVGTDTSATPPVVNQLSIGNFIGGQQLNGHIRQIAYYNTRLTNATLQALTA